MGIVLLILKILGITILCILGLILLLLALILFVPIRYRVQGKAESKQEWNGTVDVTWLLRIIHLRIEAQSPKSVKKKLRIFWFFGKKKDEVIFPKESPKEEAASAETNRRFQRDGRCDGDFGFRRKARFGSVFGFGRVEGGNADNAGGGEAGGGV